MFRMTRRNFLGTAGVAAVFPALGAHTAQAQTRDAAIAVEKDVVFGKGGDMDLRCDLYRPVPGTEKRMATIHLHGGGFTGGSKDALAERIRPFAVRGYLAIAAQYRLAGQAKWPSQIEDVKAAVRWTRANAKSLGIDPQRIAIVGYSAGGHLALMAAGTQSRSELEGRGGNGGPGAQVAACAAYYAVTELSPGRDGTASVLLPNGSDAAAHRAASPTTYVTKGFPPTVLFHGVADTTVPIESSQRFMQLLRDAGVTTELHTFAGAPHAFDSMPEAASACALLADFFFDRYIVNPRAFPPFGGGGGRGRGTV
jgi:acetyl esterase/lipase